MSIVADLYLRSAMSRPALLFISYERADGSQRRRLDVALAPLRHEGLIEIWHDDMLVPGQVREQEIEQNLSRADVVLLLISPDFVASEYCLEREMTLALKRHQSGEALVIPILLRPTDGEGLHLMKLQVLPIDRRPISTWNDADAAWLAVAQGVRQAVTSRLARTEEQLRPENRAETAPAPLSLRIPPPKGAYDQAWYLERSDEQERAQMAWAVPGSPVVLQAPELFGKTWVLMQLLSQLQAHGLTVYVLVKTIGDEALVSFSTFLRELARLMLERCGFSDVDVLLDQAWRRSTNQEANLTWLITTKVLPPLAASGRWLVLAFDGIDALAEKSYFDRFLTLLRGMAETASIPPWGALRLVLTVSSSIALRGLDIHRSPLENVAQIIQLAELLPAQVRQLAAWYGFGDGEQAQRELRELVGGHPYLVHLALHEAHHRKLPLSQVLLPQARIFDSYIQMCRKRLLQHPSLHEALRPFMQDERSSGRLSPLPGSSYEESISRLIDAGFLSDDYDAHGTRTLRLRYQLYRRIG